MWWRELPAWGQGTSDFDPKQDCEAEECQSVAPTVHQLSVQDPDCFLVADTGSHRVHYLSNLLKTKDG